MWPRFLNQDLATAVRFPKGSTQQTEALYKGSLAIVEKAFGPDHPNVATILKNLARLLSENRLGTFPR